MHAAQQLPTIELRARAWASLRRTFAPCLQRVPPSPVGRRQQMRHVKAWDQTAWSLVQPHLPHSGVVWSLGYTHARMRRPGTVASRYEVEARGVVVKKMSLPLQVVQNVRIQQARVIIELAV